MRYAVKVFLLSTILLASIAALRILVTHYFSPTNMGIQGAIRNSPVDILLVGSSHTRQSYDIARLERVSGRSAFAVAYNGFDLRAMATFLSAFLRNPKSRPKLIVLEAYCVNLSAPPHINDTRYFFDAPPVLKLRI